MVVRLLIRGRMVLIIRHLTLLLLITTEAAGMVPKVIKGKSIQSTGDTFTDEIVTCMAALLLIAKTAIRMVRTTRTRTRTNTTIINNTISRIIEADIITIAVAIINIVVTKIDDFLDQDRKTTRIIRINHTAVEVASTISSGMDLVEVVIRAARMHRYIRLLPHQNLLHMMKEKPTATKTSKT